MNAPATPINALVMTPRVDPENWRASHEGPASRSNKKPAMTPIARTRRNVTVGSVACMGKAAFSGLNLKIVCVPGVATIASRCDYRRKAKRSIRVNSAVSKFVRYFRSTPITGRSRTSAACLRSAKIGSAAWQSCPPLRMSISCDPRAGSALPGGRAPQDEVSLKLVVRRAATPRVCNYGTDRNQPCACRAIKLSKPTSATWNH
jgi:hypothetical protein